MDNLTNELNKLDYEFKSALTRHDEVAQSRLNDAMCDLEAKMRDMFKTGNRPEVDVEAAEGKSAFNSFLRSGETKSMSVAVNADGGYAVPKVVDNVISNRLVEVSDMRSLASVINVSSDKYSKLHNVGGTGSGWVGETDARPETATPKFVEITPAFGEVYANAFITQFYLHDAMFDAEAFITSEAATEFARAEGNAFLLGDGVKKPKGLLTATTAATKDSARAFGTVQHIASGAAAALTNPDKLIEMTQSLKAGFRPGASWGFNRSTIGVIRSFKDANGRYMLEPSYQAGQPSTLLGYTVNELEDMPDIAAGNIAGFFGDLKAAYLIADVTGTSVLRDPYTTKPSVCFYFTKRVGGTIADTEAVKFLKIAAS